MNDFYQEIQQILLEEITSEKPDTKRLRDLFISAFCKEVNTSHCLESEDNNIDIAEVIRWLNEMLDLLLPIFNTKKYIDLPKVSLTLPHKINLLSQYHCPICTSSYPISVINIKVLPISKQASTPAQISAFREVIKSKFNKQNYNFEDFWGKTTGLCVHITFILAQTTRNKDADNMAKSLLDAIKGILFEDDMQIDHLSLLKIRGGTEDYIKINIRKSFLNLHEDVIFKPDI